MSIVVDNAKLILSKKKLQFIVFVGKAASLRRLKMARKTDERLQLTTEVLSAIKTVKMYTWEGFFESKLTLIRK